MIYMSLPLWRKLGSLAICWAHSEDSDQPGWMPRLIWVFAGRTCHFVGFVMTRLIYKVLIVLIDWLILCPVMCKLSELFTNEPRHDKTNKMSVRPVKTQISLGICPVWSESLLCTQWVAKDPRFLHADSEDSDQTGRMPRLIWVFAGRTAILLVLSSRLKCFFCRWWLSPSGPVVSQCYSYVGSNLSLTSCEKAEWWWHQRIARWDCLKIVFFSPTYWIGLTWNL